MAKQKYDENVKEKAVQMAQEGKTLSEISKELGPNPKAVKRYCDAAGVVIKKAEKKAKKEEQPDIL